MVGVGSLGGGGGEGGAALLHPKWSVLTTLPYHHLCICESVSATSGKQSGTHIKELPFSKAFFLGGGGGGGGGGGLKCRADQNQTP